MMNALNLLWIVPLMFSIGALMQRSIDRLIISELEAMNNEQIIAMKHSISIMYENTMKADYPNIPKENIQELQALVEMATGSVWWEYDDDKEGE